MTPDSAARSMQTARTYKVQEKNRMNGDTLSIVDTLAKNIANNSANKERADSLLQEVSVKLPARTDSYLRGADTLRVAGSGHLLDNGAIVCGDCYRPGEDNGTRYDISRVDCPAHCEGCEALIPCDLTEYGRQYVAREIMRYLIEPSSHDRPKVLRTWATYYDHGEAITEIIRLYTESDKGEIILALMEARGLW